MPTDIAIRLAAYDDVAALKPLLDQLIEQHVRIRPDLFQACDDSGRLAKIVAEDDAELFVAESLDRNEPQIVGLLSARVVHPATPVFRPGTSVVIDDLVVDRPFRGRGIAEQLIEQAGRWARERGAGSLVINVWHDNRAAVLFFTSSGFQPLCHKMELRFDDPS